VLFVETRFIVVDLLAVGHVTAWRHRGVVVAGWKAELIGQWSRRSPVFQSRDVIHVFLKTPSLFFWRVVLSFNTKRKHIRMLNKKTLKCENAHAIQNPGKTYKKLSYCWETVRRESMPRTAEMDVEMTT